MAMISFIGSTTAKAIASVYLRKLLLYFGLPSEMGNIECHLENAL